MQYRICSTAVVVLGLVLNGASPSVGQATPPPQASPTVQQFTGALSAYNAGQFARAAAILEALQAHDGTSYDLHELLGLTYGALDRNPEAAEQLQLAVQLNPDSLTARTNLATALVHVGQYVSAEEQSRRALTLDPTSYLANRMLAQLYLRKVDPVHALPFLQAAQTARPTAADNGYDLSLALLLEKHYPEAANLTHALLAQHDTGELHTLLGRIEEQQGKYLDAARDFATAARMDPTEDNLFNWASELLLHRAYEAAITVYQSATERFPASPRLWTGLGMAYYSRGEYPNAIAALLKAADLKPDDPRCYLFLSKAYLSAPGQAEQVISRFQRYAMIQPENALAQYYYGISLWKGRRLETSEVDYQPVEALFLKSIALDGTLAETHLQLGILYNDEQQYAKAMPEYQRALALDPKLADAHFRLGRAYLRAGEKAKAQAEFNVFKTLQAEHQALLDQERANVQQFVVSKPPTAPASQ